ncbi:glucans biosynthesis glucosyltransferase MdoH [Rhizobiales bacterium]|uniref:glucans biosynthesis glucosyltransferase MdoH n=1 Tax=Hongsoonwoonella zoysiae TaxID=2821844 RepID=UPI0015608BDA|nr:glucans biosynthesis glucosyltransferase MdoH [Hongsoonwoonella zoysiae]NRG16335.1 glucans biosynthesis glucosyltransferase MdoH [Hongsoonwoonella zoysiae]
MLSAKIPARELVGENASGNPEGEAASRRNPMAFRRLVFAAFVLSSMAGLIALMSVTLSTNGISWGEGAMLVCFAATLPWTVIGFWNAVVGLLVMRLSKDPVARVCPVAVGDKSLPLSSSTAVLSCIRNEDVDAVAANLEAMITDLVRSGEAGAFRFYVLSDTSNEIVAAREERVFADLAERWRGDMGVIYRRRKDNFAFKSGNIRDFCERWGHSHDYALVLDADSFMSASTILDMVRRMEANPRLGILQSLVVGMPTTSAFARVFQFGMRLGMRSYTTGSAWWQGDCGPYWGHNAVLRLKPFIEACHLPVLPGKGPLSGPILSHDQVEAVLMRRAGYEVRVLPLETESFEENPPDLLEFIRRELRWCQGNLQYLKLLGLSGIKATSRIQLVLAILMFVSSPAWLIFMALAATLAVVGGDQMLQFDATTGFALFCIIMTMVFAPKIATVLDILADRKLRKRFGGGLRVVAGTAGEIAFSALLAPIMAVAVSVFIAGLPFGRAMGWGAQARSPHGLPLRLTVSKLWPQALFGAAGILWTANQSWALVLPLLPVVLGPLLAVPFALLTARREAGRLALASSLWRIPEEQEAPNCLLPLRLGALTALGAGTVPDYKPDLVKADA